MTTSADRSWAAFTEHGPWEVERDRVRWLGLAATLRARAQAEVPDTESFDTVASTRGASIETVVVQFSTGLTV